MHNTWHFYIIFQEWHINAREGSIIELTFFDFYLEYDSNCFYDWVEVLFESDDRTPEKYCGSKTRWTILSTDSMTIRMRTDSDYTFSGFYAELRYIDIETDIPTCSCGIENDDNKIVGGSEVSPVSICGLWNMNIILNILFWIKFLLSGK